jgi:hypothetical protein
LRSRLHSRLFLSDKSRLGRIYLTGETASTIDPPNRMRPGKKHCGDHGNRGDRYGKGETGKGAKWAVCSLIGLLHDVEV